MSGFFPNYPHNQLPQTGTLASQPRGMNFAQTARAEELKAARARKAAHDDHEQSQQQQQQQREQGLGLPTRGPIPLGAYTVFKKRTRTKHGKVQGRSERSRNENDSQEELSRPASTVPSIPEENENENEATVKTNAQTDPMGSAHKKRESMVSGYERYLREQANKAAGSASGLGRMPMPNEATTTTATNATATTTSAFPFFQPSTIPNIPITSNAHDQNVGVNPHHHTGDFQWREDMSRHPTLVASYGRNTDKDYARLTPSSHQSSRISSLLTRQGPRYPAAGGNEYSVFPQPGPATSEGSASEDEDPFGYDGDQGVSLNPTHPTNMNAPSGKENGHGYPAKDLYWDHSNINRTITQRDFPPQPNMHPPPLPPSAAPRASVRMPPAVKGTAADKSSRRPFPTFDPRKPRTPYKGVAAAAQKPLMPEQHLHGHTDPAKRAAPNTIAAGHVRDPHPYTGFTASSNKTEMLLQSLDQRLAEEDASSKRSVLYDPMIESFRGDFARALPIRPESSFSAKQDSYASAALRRGGLLGGPDFQRDLLNKSDPLPPVPNLNGQEVDSNQIGYSSAQPNQRDDVFGAYPTTNAFTTAEMNYLREQQRQRQLQQRQEQEENARFIPAYDTGFALEELARSYEPKSQAEQDAEVMAWFTNPYAKGAHVRDILSKAGTHMVGRPGTHNNFDGASDTATPPLTARYLQTRWDYTTAAPATKAGATLSPPAAGLDLLSPLLANLHTHQLNNFRDCPFTRYTMPPAWCVDTTGLPGSKDSFFGEGEEGGWNPPKRVGRDKRRVMRVIEGRATYFEEGVGVGVVSPGSSAV